VAAILLKQYYIQYFQGNNEASVLLWRASMLLPCRSKENSSTVTKKRSSPLPLLPANKLERDDPWDLWRRLPFLFLVAASSWTTPCLCPSSAASSSFPVIMNEPQQKTGFAASLLRQRLGTKFGESKTCKTIDCCNALIMEKIGNNVSFTEHNLSHDQASNQLA